LARGNAHLPVAGARNGKGAEQEQNVCYWRPVLVFVKLIFMVAMMSDLTSAMAQTAPDTSSWRRHDLPEYGLSLMAPPDWVRDQALSEGGRNIFSLDVPDLPPDQSAGCGILATRPDPGNDLDIDDYISKMNKDRFLKALSSELTDLYLHKMEVVPLSHHKSLMTIVSGDRKSGRWTFINFDVVEGDTFFRLQCFFRPQAINDYFLVFLTLARSLKIEAQ